MSVAEKARRTDIEITVNNKQVTDDIKKYLQSLTFTDEIEDKTDDLSITIDDRDGTWMNKWLNFKTTTKSITSPVTNSSGKFKIGDRVMVKKGALFEGGVKPHPFVYTCENFTVIEVGRKNPNRIVFGINGEVTGAMDASDLYRPGENSSSGSSSAPSSRLTNSNESDSFKVGDKVRVKKGARFEGGIVPYNWVYEYEFDVLEIGRTNPRRIVFGIGKEVTGAMDAGNLYKSGSNSSGMETQSVETSNGLIGASIAATIVQTDGKILKLNCGTFNVDTISLSGPPSKITIKATSLANSSTVRVVKKSRAWEQTSLKQIATSIAEQNGLKCFFSSSYNPIYTRKEQTGESDICFLQELCKAAGVCLKVTDGKIVLFDESEYEKKDSICTLELGKSKILSYSLSDGTSDKAYSSCHVSYTDPKTGATIEYTYTPRVDNPGTGEVLEINEKVNDREEARKLAMKRLRQKNKNRFSVALKMIGNPTYTAGSTVNLKGFGGFDGKYIISQATHTISNGYTTSLKMHKCLEEY